MRACVRACVKYSPTHVFHFPDIIHKMLQVQNLLQDCSKFEQTEVVKKSEKVRKMLSLYQPIQNLPEVKSRYSDLQSRWKTFEKDVRKRVAHMELALKFHQGLLEVSCLHLYRHMLLYVGSKYFIL